MDIKGAIFDIDGTITDSLWVWDGVPEKFLKKHGKAPDTNMSELNKLNTAQIGEYFKEHYFQDSKMTPEDIVFRFGLMGFRDYAFHVGLVPGARELLKQLHQEGVKMAILTANDVRLVKAALRHNRVYRYFDLILEGSDPANAKDDPKAFENACRALGTPKEQTVVFEDSVYAIQNAKAAGFRVIGMDNGRDADRDRIADLADAYVKDYRDILDQL